MIMNFKKRLALIGMLIFSINLFAQWTQLAVNSDGIRSIFFTSADTGYVAGENAKILMTTNGGLNWSLKNSGGPELKKIKFPSKDTGYAVATFGGLYKSFNAGQSWSSSTLPSGTFYGMDFYNTNLGFLVGQGSSGGASIFKTSDGGTNWSVLDFIPTSEITDIQMLSPLLGYAVGFNFFTYEGHFYKTTDGGNSWTPQIISILPNQLMFNTVYFTDSLTGFIGGNIYDNSIASDYIGVIYKTTNGGSSWNSQNLTNVNVINDMQFINDTIGFVAGNLFGSTGCMTSAVLKTENKGNTWSLQYTGPSIYGIGSLHFPNEDVGYTMERCNGTGAVGGILKYKIDENCFAHYSVSVDSATSTFTLFVDSTTASQAVSYFWDFGDGSTSTLANPYHIVNIDTVYNVCMKIFNSLGDSCTYCHLLGKDYLSNIIRDPGFTINIENPSVITVVEQNNLINDDVFLYPNPSSGVFNISLKNKTNSQKTVAIYDMLGKMILISKSTSNEITLDLSESKQGFYFVEITQNTITQRIKLFKK